MNETTSAAENGMVLVVDDDPGSRALLRAALADAGHVPLLATDGAKALSLLKDVQPDLILMDAMMPPPDGFDTCSRIKAMPEWAHIPVIFMTGLADTDHVIKGLQAGGVDYVTKPLILDELLARIRVHLGNARLTRNAQAALDVAGRSLIATGPDGSIRWVTPQAQQLLATHGAMTHLRGHMARMITITLPALRAAASFESEGHKFELAYLGTAGNGDHLFRIIENSEGREAGILQKQLGLTPRESDVLLWVARGKSNKDASEILNISARTVNKHLEQIFIKLGVENRAAATAITIGVLSSG